MLAKNGNVKNVSCFSNSYFENHSEIKAKHAEVDRLSLQMSKKEPRSGSKSRTRTVKIIKKVKKGQEGVGSSPAGTRSFDGRRWTEYEVRKIKIDKHGRRSVHSIQNHDRKPKEYIDFYDALSNLQVIRSNSSTQLERLRKSFSHLKEPYSTQDAIKATEAATMPEYRALSKTSGSLSKLLHAENLTSINMIDEGSRAGPGEDAGQKQKIFVQSAGKEQVQKKRRKKYIIFNKKRYSDGSQHRRKQVIYEGYGAASAKLEGKRTNSQVDYYTGSATAIKRVLQRGNHLISFNVDGSIELKQRSRQGPLLTKSTKLDEVKSTQESNRIGMNTSLQMTKTAQHSYESQEGDARTIGKDFLSYEKLTDRYQKERALLNRELKKKTEAKKKNKAKNQLLEESHVPKRTAQTRR